MGCDRGGRPTGGGDEIPGLSRCPACASALVELLDASEAGPGVWHVRRCCPECRWQGADFASADALAQFEADLQAGRDSLLRLLAAMQAPVGGPPL